MFNIPFRKSKFNLFSNIKNLLSFINTLRSLDKHNIIHAITIKPIVYLILSSSFIYQKKFVISFSGLGYFFINNNFITIIFRFIFFFYFKKFVIKNNPYIIFQNRDDLKYFQKQCSNLIKRYRIIKGSGINLKEFNFHKQNFSDKINFTLISRILLDKGILEFMDASNQLLAQNIHANFIIIGDIDYNNPRSMKRSLLNEWQNGANKFYLGFKKNIKKHIIKSNVIVLPSYREGMPKILLEASAIGRPIITTDVPGCRECVINNYNGFLIKSKSNEHLKNSMLKFLNNNDQLVEMGIASNKIAVKNYSIDKVINDHLTIYESI